VQICTANCCYPDGRDFVGIGVQPDIPVEPTINGIAEGHDEVLQAALDYIRSDGKKDTVPQSPDSEGSQTAEVASISSLTKEERVCGLAKLWAAIKYRCAVLQYVEVDWDQALPEYIRLAQQTKNDAEYYLLLEKMLALLKDNHTYLKNMPGR